MGGSHYCGALDIAANMQDLFSNLALKYRTLLGLSKDARVLLAGEFFSQRARQFQDVFQTIDIINDSWPRFDRESEGGAYDLICLDYLMPEAGASFLAMASTAAKLISDKGTMILLVTNRNIPGRLQSYLSGRKSGHAHSLPLHDYQQDLATAGFTNLEPFLAVPNCIETEEHVSVSVRHLELPSHVSFRIRWLNWFGLLSRFHDEYLIFASKHESIGLSLLGDNVGDIPWKKKLAGVPVVEKLLLRNRGAIIAALRDKESNEGVLIRISPSIQIDEVLSRNLSATVRLHQCARLRQKAKDLIPRVQMVVREGAGSVYFETLLPGVLLWTLKNGSAKTAGFDGACDFLVQLFDATNEESVIDEARFQNLAGNCLDTLRGKFESERSVVRDLDKIEDWLQFRVLKRSIPLAIGHGDFGYGNILCDPRTGELSGIIDWDTYVESEYPGVDMCNLLIQVTREGQGRGLAAAVSSLFIALHAGQAAIEPLRAFCSATGLADGVDIEVSMLLAAIRYIGRAASYDQEFRSSYADSCETVRLVATEIGIIAE